MLDTSTRRRRPRNPSVKARSVANDLDETSRKRALYLLKQAVADAPFRFQEMLSGRSTCHFYREIVDDAP